MYRVWALWAAGALLGLPFLLRQAREDPRTQSVIEVPVGAGRDALLDAMRTHLKTTSRFKVGHVREANGWAFVRATEVVPIERDEPQETDLTVAALLERQKSSAWRVLEIWTLPGDDRLPMAELQQRLGIYRASVPLPDGLFPDDLRRTK